MAKIQSLQDVNGNIIYPKSVASAIHYDNEHTVGELISDSVYIDTNNDNNIDIDNPIDATTLNGHNSDYYAKKNDLDVLTTHVNNNTKYIDDTKATIQNVKNMAFESITLYVNKSGGNDDKNDGSITAPFKTIQAAINKVFVGATDVTIKIASGTYDENLVINNRLSRNIYIGAQNDADEVNVNSLIVLYSNMIILDHIKFNDLTTTVIDGVETNPFSVLIQYSNAEIKNCTFTSSKIAPTIDEYTTSEKTDKTYGLYGYQSNINIYDNKFNQYYYPIYNMKGNVRVFGIKGYRNTYMYACGTGMLLFDENGLCDTYDEYHVNRVYLIDNKAMVINPDTITNLKVNNYTARDAVKTTASGNNSLYVEKDITDLYKDGSLFYRIRTGFFDGLNVGNYFTVDDFKVSGYTIQPGGNKFYIAGFDCFYSSSLKRHHIVIIPASYMFTDYADSSKTYSSYYNMNVWRTIIPKINTGLTTIFGNHLIKYRSNDYDTIAMLCSYDQIYYNQIPIFKLKPAFKGNIYCWTCTTSVYYDDDDTYYRLYTYKYNTTGYDYPNYSKYGIRPYFLLGY